MILRMLRSSTQSGHGPSPLARLLALLLLIVMLGASAPVLIPMVRWVISLVEHPGGAGEAPVGEDGPRTSVAVEEKA
jgi:hypothetical protein